jgi:virginiamycin B lyase
LHRGFHGGFRLRVHEAAHVDRGGWVSCCAKTKAGVGSGCQRRAAAAVRIQFALRNHGRPGRQPLDGKLTTFALSGSGFPERVTAAPDGSVWFTDPANNRIGRLTEADRIERTLGTGLWLPQGKVSYFQVPTPKSGPAGITIGPDGNVWFAEHAANKIARLAPNGKFTEFPLPQGGGPAGITTGRDGNLWFAENAGDRIGRISSKGQIKEFPVPSSASKPNGIVQAAGGDLWFTELATGQIARITPDGEITEFTLPIQGVPFGISAGSDGNVWVTVIPARAVCKVTPTGSVTSFVMKGVTTPIFIASDKDGNLWFTQPNGRIGRLSPSGTLTEFPLVRVKPAMAAGS